ncbi:MAG: NAD-dependent epimerase/dehydratase family protein [Caulobacteraceae bacterium]|nr:NAD-dependent epimerase/dehydratase family protein [Caulobacteraceae bacterium]
MRVLITGGAGFIGGHIADRLVAEGRAVEILDDLSTGKRGNVPPGAVLREIDLRDPAGVARVVADFAPDVVCHQAAQASVAVSVREPALDAEVNIIGTLNLLRVCAANAVKRVVFASTGGAIYGEIPEGGRAAVGALPAPASPYAASKMAAESYLEVFRQQRGLDYTILRYANVYGLRQDPHGEAGVVAVFASRLLSGAPIQINARRDVGDEGCIRDYVHVDDVVAANLAALRGEIAARVVNVGAGVGTSTLELAKILARATAGRSQFTFAPRRPGDLERSVLEPSPEAPCDVSLEDGLHRTVAWFRESHAEIQAPGTRSTPSHR